MALEISTYVDPGVYQGEVLVPGAFSLAGQPTVIGIVGPGSRVKRTSNRAVLRGEIEGETLTVSASAPHTAKLGWRSTRRKATTTVYRQVSNGPKTALADSFVSFTTPKVTTTASGTIDLSAANPGKAFCIEMDGRVAITIELLYATGASTTVAGTYVQVKYPFSGTSGNAATLAEIAAAINSALAAASSTAIGGGANGYGSDYANAATIVASAIVIASPTTINGVPANPAQQDVRTFIARKPGMAVSLLHDDLFGTQEENADHYIEISPTVYVSGATYTIDYVTAHDTDDGLDVIETSPIEQFVRVGTFPGSGNFALGTDYKLATSSDVTLDWPARSSPSHAKITGLTQTYDLSTNDRLQVSVDGRPPVDIDLDGLSSPPYGYKDPATPSAATAAEVAGNISSILAAHPSYGARYNNVAMSVSNSVEIEPTGYQGAFGESSTITLHAPSSNDATAIVFGITASSLPYEATGDGKIPGLGTTYYATYDITRPATDYNVQKAFTSLDAAMMEIGPESSGNPLAIATKIAFTNNAPIVVVVQVDDSYAPGAPTRSEYAAAADALKTSDTVTDVVPLTDDLSVLIDFKSHVEFETSPVNRHYRRLWTGKAAGTAIGDRDTADTIIHLAATSLQPAADSPARGRMNVIAPPQQAGVTTDVTEADTGEVTTVTLGSWYLAAAVAAKQSSFTSPATALVRKTITGFNIDDITQPWEPAQRHLMAQSGVNVITYDAGNFVMLDPVTTEGAGGGEIKFLQPSASVQKDTMVRRVNRRIDALLVGIVPTSPADFVLDIKLVIGGALAQAIGNGDIGPFRAESGEPRPIDYGTDIIAYVDASNPTSFRFKYAMMLRYPALRFFGEYSVDNPFLAAG